MPWPAGAWQQYTVVPEKGLVCSLCPTLSVDWAVSSYSGRSTGDSAGLLTCHMGKDLRFVHSSLSSQPVTQVRFCRSISIAGQGAVLCQSVPFASVHSIFYRVARPSCGCQGSLLDHLYTLLCHGWARAAQIAVPDGVSDETASQYFANPLSGMHILPPLSFWGPALAVWLCALSAEAVRVLETYMHIRGTSECSCNFLAKIPCLGPASLKCHSHAYAALGLVEDAAVPKGEYLLQVSTQEKGVPLPSALQ